MLWFGVNFTPTHTFTPPSHYSGEKRVSGHFLALSHSSRGNIPVKALRGIFQEKTETDVGWTKLNPTAQIGSFSDSITIE